MFAFTLLAIITVLYAGYNILIKISGNHVPADATTTVAATMCLQLAGFATSAVFMVALLIKGGHAIHLPPRAYAWAAAAGLCIGGAEIAYFYLFGGIGMAKPIAANIGIPVIVGGTIVISMLLSFLVLREPLTWNHLLGSGLIIAGVLVFFLRNDTASTGLLG